jgi:DNA-binding NtrC family response regulator
VRNPAERPHGPEFVTIKAEREMRAATILIVDDQQQVLRMVEFMLHAAGYKVYGASNATEALAVARQVGCGLNLLLTDMMMPGIDGHDLILAIRRLCPNVDTIVMSGALLADDVRIKNYKIIWKPFTMDQLVEVVKEVLGGQLG